MEATKTDALSSGWDRALVDAHAACERSSRAASLSSG
jgi:hypothetical protein